MNCYLIGVCAQVSGNVDHILMEDTRKKTLLSTCYEIHLRPTVILHNSLPVALHLTTYGTSTRFEILPGASCNLSTIEPGSSSVVMKVIPLASAHSAVINGAVE